MKTPESITIKILPDMSDFEDDYYDQITVKVAERLGIPFNREKAKLQRMFDDGDEFLAEYRSRTA